jgi:hypothetical protein
MKNLVLITSIIDIPIDKPFNYTNIRSIYSREERFEDTKQTIASIKKYIPDSMIILIDCSKLRDYEEEYLKNNCSYVLNLWENKELHNDIFGISKSLGEGLMMIKALEYILKKDIIYDNLFKISGRYKINNNFNYDNFNNNNCIFLKYDVNNVSTVLYKITKKYTKELYEYLILNYNKMKECIQYEILINSFIEKKINNIIYVNKLGIEGKVSVSKDYYNS